MRTLRELIGGKDIWWGIALLMLLGNVIGLAWYSLITGKDLKLIEAVVLQMITFIALLLNFRYGSSKGSKDKDKPTNTGQ